ncbi:unnamed protein product [Dicrocoelium dendriticum]|nr:unnamed protein product [Dicrocoelium dendriticum]
MLPYIEKYPTSRRRQLLPGQGRGESDLPHNFPTMQHLAEAMHEICDTLGFKHVVVFGDGVGANVLARFAVARKDLVLGAVLINCTGTAASVTESLREKVIVRKLHSSGMNPTAEAQLVLHRFGAVSNNLGI